MYLSKLILDPSHPHARRDLANAYEMHRSLSRVFSASPETSPKRFLWRLESNAGVLSNGGAIVLVQSGEPGDWESVIQQLGYSQALHPNKQVELNELLGNGRSYTFRLACNPTVSRAGKRYGLVRESEQLSWLERQGGQHGFDLRSVAQSRSERITVHQGQAGNRITLQVVRFDGVLRAKNVESLRQALLCGIGHAKALGLGLLSLAPRVGES